MGLLLFDRPHPCSVRDRSATDIPPYNIIYKYTTVRYRRMLYTGVEERKKKKTVLSEHVAINFLNRIVTRNIIFFINLFKIFFSLSFPRDYCYKFNDRLPRRIVVVRFSVRNFIIHYGHFYCIFYRLSRAQTIFFSPPTNVTVFFPYEIIIGTL